jgi:glycerate kinase
VVALAADLEGALSNCELVVTGEGALDATSLAGKVVGGVLEWAEDLAIERRAVLAGRATDDARLAVERRGARVLTLVERAWSDEEAIDRAAVLLEEAAVEIARGAPRS